MNQVNLQSIVWQEEQQFVAQCLNVDVSSFGSTKEEALTNLREALELYFEDTSFNHVHMVKNPEVVITSLARA